MAAEEEAEASATTSQVRGTTGEQVRRNRDREAQESIAQDLTPEAALAAVAVAVVASQFADAKIVLSVPEEGSIAAAWIATIVAGAGAAAVHVLALVVVPEARQKGAEESEGVLRGTEVFFQNYQLGLAVVIIWHHKLAAVASTGLILRNCKRVLQEPP